MDDSDILRQAPLFSGLDDEAADALQASLIECRLRRSEVLFREGDEGHQLYVVTDGKVKMGRTSTDGRENLLALLGPGQMFGELSLFDPGPRQSTVTAVTDCVMQSLTHDELLQWLTGRPEVAQGCSPSSPTGCAGPTTSWPIWCSPTCPDVSPRRCWIWRPVSAGRPTTGSTCTTTSPRRSWPSWWAPRRDGQQGAGRLRITRLAAARTPLGRPARRRTPPRPRPLTPPPLPPPPALSSRSGTPDLMG